MSLPIHVQSVEVISGFRATLCRVGEDAKNALAAAEMEINRMIDWLNNDRRLYWQAEIKRRREELSRAKSELFRRRTSQMFGHDSAFSEQREIERKAKERVEQAERKLERVRQWVLPLQQAVMEYRAASRPLADAIEGDLERALALLDNMARAIEQYAAGSAPSTAYVSSMRKEGTAASETSPQPGSGESTAPPPAT